jgi:uncharacterized protein YecE (DUF72 family)
MPPLCRIGTVDLPARVERERYFQELSYLELSALFQAPLKSSSLARWQSVAPAGALGLVAPWVLTHRKPPASGLSWPHDSTVGDFRISTPGQEALTALRGAVTTLTPGHVLFRSPPLFAPSSANREQLRRFFGELATEAAVGASRVWSPDGLWEPRIAVKFASEIGVTCAIDPLIHDPSTPAEVYEDLEAAALYFRVAGIGRAGPIRTEKLEDLAGLVEHYRDIPLTVVFASTARWQDARNFKKLLGVSSSPDPDPDPDLEDDDLDPAPVDE